MANRTFNNIKLGIFVMAGLLFLVVLLYMIGKDQNLFGSNIRIKTRLSHASGIVAGNNVRYAGIQVGTVKSVALLNDSTVEITMLIDEKIKANIHKNAIVSIGTEGLIGNKIVNILPGKGTAAAIEEGDMLEAKRLISTDEMMETLAQSNNNIAIISEELKQTVKRINASSALWKLLNEETLPDKIKASAKNIEQATVKANIFLTDLDALITDVQNGKGSVGAILKDTAFAVQLREALTKLNIVGSQAEQLVTQVDSLATSLQQEVNNGQGTVHALLKDTAIAKKLNASLTNIENGTNAFAENMEALKHNFLLRGYFRRQEKRQQKAAIKPGKKAEE
ncbi:MAG TPA: MlaD family protein [Chitinophagaceae bacterium]|nr:MlaD family protein [Chitinophagaceae bacterium]